MRVHSRAFGLILLCVTGSVSAQIRGPEGDRGFRNVYPVSASAAQTEHLYRTDLKLLAREASRLAATDGGTLTADHRAYLATRRALIDRRYAEATGRSDG